MRYREGTFPGETLPPPEPAIFAGAAVLGLLMGVLLALLGLRARLAWLAVWGAGLVVASLAYLVAFATGAV
jgi:hypothetical protein